MVMLFDDTEGDSGPARGGGWLRSGGNLGSLSLLFDAFEAH
jgi:hypothetical protein